MKILRTLLALTAFSFASSAHAVMCDSNCSYDTAEQRDACLRQHAERGEDDDSCYRNYDRMINYCRTCR